MNLAEDEILILDPHVHDFSSDEFGKPQSQQGMCGWQSARRFFGTKEWLSFWPAADK